MNYTQCGSALALPYADGTAGQIGTELNPKYLRLQDDRTQVTIGLGMVLA